MATQENKVEADRQAIAEAQQRGTLATLGVYTRLSGPGWLQSAITLGGGSLASSLFLGVLAGFSLLWLQPVAMILGIIMLSAIGYVTLSTGERPFRAINRHVNPVLGWSWALASLAASMVWCLPQYSLATAVLQQNLLPDVLGGTSELGDFRAKLLIAGVILVVTTVVTWSYDSGSWGIRLYEWLLKILVGVIVICFFAVVIRMTLSDSLDWSLILQGFIPDPTLLTRPSPGFAAMLENVPTEFRQFWSDRIVVQQRDVLFSAAATAVGINMTFLLPYSLLRRGWTREFRGLLRFDLATGMFVPFVLATSCVIIAAATQFHPGLAPESVEKEIRQKASGKTTITGGDEKAINGAKAGKLRFELKGENLDKETFKAKLTEVELTQVEKELALALVPRKAMDLANSLNNLTGSSSSDVIFGLGVVGMTLSTITILMLISGMVICEMFNLPPTGWPHRLATLAATTGVLGPFVWGELGFYLAVPTSVFGLMLLPIAYLTFFLLMNQKKLLGDSMPKGVSRLVWNLLMFVAAGVASVASVWAIWQKAGWLGIGAAVGLLGLAIFVQVIRSPEPEGQSSGVNHS